MLETSKPTNLNQYACEVLRLISNELGDRKFESTEATAELALIIPLDDDAIADPERIAKAFVAAIPPEATRCARLRASKAIDQCHIWNNRDNGVTIRLIRMWDVMASKIVMTLDGAFI